MVLTYEEIRTRLNTIIEEMDRQTKSVRELRGRVNRNTIEPTEVETQILNKHHALVKIQDKYAKLAHDIAIARD